MYRYCKLFFFLFLDTILALILNSATFLIFGGKQAQNQVDNIRAMTITKSKPNQFAPRSDLLLVLSPDRRDIFHSTCKK